jgi:hypothetical protein
MQQYSVELVVVPTILGKNMGIFTILGVILWFFQSECVLDVWTIRCDKVLYRESLEKSCSPIIMAGFGTAELV